MTTIKINLKKCIDMIIKFAYNNYCSECAGVAEWQTHLTQNQAGNTVWVQVPPPAPVLRVA